MDILHQKIRNYLGSRHTDELVDSMYHNIMVSHYKQHILKYPTYKIPNIDDSSGSIFINTNFATYQNGQKNLFIEFKFIDGIFSHDYFKGCVLSLHGHNPNSLYNEHGNIYKQLPKLDKNDVAGIYDDSRFHLHLGGSDFKMHPNFNMGCDDSNYNFYIKTHVGSLKVKTMILMLLNQKNLLI